jgi:hypothetical protein
MLEEEIGLFATLRPTQYPSERAKVVAQLTLVLRCVRAVQALQERGGDWVLRKSGTGRGWRLHQSFSGERDTHDDVLAAIEASTPHAAILAAGDDAGGETT